ncbi:hypothetical protein Tco_1201101 [Tanacetum coccineum]
MVRIAIHPSAFLTQGTVSNIPIVFSWGDSIRPEGFLSSVLLWLVIIVAVVGVGVTGVVVIESSYVSLRFRGGNIPSYFAANPCDENFHHFSESGTTMGHKLPIPWNHLIYVPEIIPP